MATIDEIKQQAEAVKNATQVGENTALRVGGAISGLADIAKQQDTELGKKFDKESVVQESGNAEDKVMSQKAVSDKLDELAAQFNDFATVTTDANNIILVTGSRIFKLKSGTRIIHQRIGDITLVNDVSIELTVGWKAYYIVFNSNTNTFRIVRNDDSLKLLAKEVVVCLLRSDECILAGRFTSYTLDDKIVNLINKKPYAQELGDAVDAAASQKLLTEQFNDFATVTTDANNIILVTGSRIFKLKSGTRIIHQRIGDITLVNDVSIELTVGWKAYYIVFNSNTNTFRIVRNDDSLKLLAKEVVVCLLRSDECILAGRFTSYTLDDKIVNLINKNEQFSLSTIAGNYKKSIGIFGGSLSVYSESDAAKNIWKKTLNVSITNYGVPGAGFSSLQGTSIQQQVNGAKKHDIYILWASTNDFTNDRECGTKYDYTEYDNFDTSKLVTQCGGINYAIKKLYEINPLAEIYLFTSLRFFSSDSGHNPFSTITNSTGKRFSEYVDAQKECALLHSIPCLDQFNIQGVNSYNYTNYYKPDKLHMTTAGYEKIAYKQVEFLMNGK